MKRQHQQKHVQNCTKMRTQKQQKPLIFQDCKKKTGMVQEKLLLHMIIPSMARWEM